jgi:hypothetical protein
MVPSFIFGIMLLKPLKDFSSLQYFIGFYIKSRDHILHQQPYRLVVNWPHINPSLFLFSADGSPRSRTLASWAEMVSTLTSSNLTASKMFWNGVGHIPYPLNEVSSSRLAQAQPAQRGKSQVPPSACSFDTTTSSSRAKASTVSSIRVSRSRVTSFAPHKGYWVMARQSYMTIVSPSSIRVE